MGGQGGSAPRSLQLEDCRRFWRGTGLRRPAAAGRASQGRRRRHCRIIGEWRRAVLRRVKDTLAIVVVGGGGEQQQQPSEGKADGPRPEAVSRPPNLKRPFPKPGLAPSRPGLSRRLVAAATTDSCMNPRRNTLPPLPIAMRDTVNTTRALLPAFRTCPSCTALRT